MKKNILILVPIVGLPVAILFIFDTRLWLTARDIVPPDYYFIAKLITNWGLYLFYAIFTALFVYSFSRKNRKLTGLVSGLPQSPAHRFVCGGPNFEDSFGPGPARSWR